MFVLRSITLCNIE